MMELSDLQRAHFKTDGYLCPIPVLTAREVEKYRAHYDEFREWIKDRLEKVTPSERFRILHETHLVLPWIYELVSHPRIIAAVQSLLGDNLVVWNSIWFAKDPHDRAFTSWHQDGTYWNFDPAIGITAWVALTPSVPSNGCVRVIPQTHHEVLAHRETHAKDNMLSRGQEIQNVNESKAVDLALQPGEMSLHEFWLVHGSHPNSSGMPRIGLAIRYTRPDVKGPRFLVSVVHGRDTHGNFEVVPAPTHTPTPDEYNARHAELSRRAQAVYGVLKIE